MFNITIIFLSTVFSFFSSQCMEIEKSEPEIIENYFGSREHLAGVKKLIQDPELAREWIPAYLNALQNDCLRNCTESREKLLSFMRKDNPDFFNRVYGDFCDQYQKLLVHGNRNVKTSLNFPYEWFKEIGHAVYDNKINPLAIDFATFYDSKTLVEKGIDCHSITYDNCCYSTLMKLDSINIKINHRLFEQQTKDISLEDKLKIIRCFAGVEINFLKNSNVIDGSMVSLMKDLKQLSAPPLEVEEYNRTVENLLNLSVRCYMKMSILTFVVKNLQACCDAMMLHHCLATKLAPRMVTDFRKIACYRKILDLHDYYQKLAIDKPIVFNESERLQELPYENSAQLTKQWIYAMQKEYVPGEDPLKFVLGL